VPLYEYACSSCEKEFTIRHPYNKPIHNCALCGEEGCLEKILSTSNIVVKKIEKKKVKVGQVTDEAIFDAKKDLEEQKKELKKKNK
jgi:putative FmdB family regulatory protein|tara:strand:+ start:3454 stop:3711 length:258 start_codon:yes stop_codon:yes gene_type:complete